MRNTLGRISGRPTPTYMHATTNNENCLRVNPDSRRYVVIEASSALRGDTAYFRELSRLIDDSEEHACVLPVPDGARRRRQGLDQLEAGDGVRTADGGDEHDVRAPVLQATGDAEVGDRRPATSSRAITAGGSFQEDLVGRAVHGVQHVAFSQPRPVRDVAPQVRGASVEARLERREAYGVTPLLEGEAGGWHHVLLGRAGAGGRASDQGLDLRGRRRGGRLGHRGRGAEVAGVSRGRRQRRLKCPPELGPASDRDSVTAVTIENGTPSVDQVV